LASGAWQGFASLELEQNGTCAHDPTKRPAKKTRSCTKNQKKICGGRGKKKRRNESLSRRKNSWLVIEINCSQDTKQRTSSKKKSRKKPGPVQKTATEV